MEISIYSLFEGAEWATGSVAVIDVFRAFTTAAVALANGASSIVMVRSVDRLLHYAKPESAMSVWVRSGVERHRALILVTHHSRSWPSISVARPLSSGPAPVRRGLSRLEAEPTG